MSDNQREAGTIILDPTHASFAPEETVHDLGATHFIGIGGAGMSVLAEMLRCSSIVRTKGIPYLGAHLKSLRADARAQPGQCLAGDAGRY